MIGLGLDVAQLFGGAAAAPNAFLAGIKGLLKFIRRIPDPVKAKKMAQFLADIAQKVLIKWRGERILQGAQFFWTAQALKAAGDVRFGSVSRLFGIMDISLDKAFSPTARFRESYWTERVRWK